MIARLESTKDISSISDTLKALAYDVVQQNDKIAFIHRKSGSSSDLGRDIKSAKEACKFTGAIKCIYGTSTSSY